MNPLQITARQAIIAATQRADDLALVHGIAMFIFLVTTTIIAIRLYTQNRWPWQKYPKALPCLPYFLLSLLARNATKVYAYYGLAVNVGNGETVTIIPHVLPSTCKGTMNGITSFPCRYERVTTYLQTFDGSERYMLAPGFLDIYKIGFVWPLIALALLLFEYKILPFVQRKHKQKGVGWVPKLIVSCGFFFVAGCCGTDALLLMGLATFLAKLTWSDEEGKDRQIVEGEDDMDVVIDVAGT